MNISVSKLSNRYPGGKLALNNIDLDIPKGLFGILGPSRGRVSFNRLDLEEQREELLAPIGSLPQEFGTYKT